MKLTTEEIKTILAMMATAYAGKTGLKIGKDWTFEQHDALQIKLSHELAMMAPSVRKNEYDLLG